MTLRIIEPFAITESDIDSTNVTLETAWAAGTYTLGQVARVGERMFEVSAASTTQEPGLTASTEWFDAGPANRYAAFDLQFGADQYRVIDTITTRADSITYTLSGLPRLSAMAFFGLKATQITIVGTLDTAGDVADVTYDLQDGTPYLGSMWRWSFMPQSFERSYANFDLNIPIGSTVTITITNTGATAEVSTIAMGIADEYGTVGVGTTRGLRNRSVKKTEGTLTSLLRRTPSFSVGYDILLTSYEAAPFWRKIDDLDSVAAVFAGPDDNSEFIVYGFVSSCQAVSQVFGNTNVKLEVETL